MELKPISATMKRLFQASIALMAAHKVECWLTDEWTDSPFFTWLVELPAAGAPIPPEAAGELVFLTFVTWLFIGLTMAALVLRGGAGPAIALGLWGLTFLLEWHHVVRTITSGAYYSGVITAVLYLSLGLFYWRELLSHLPERAPA